MENFIHLKSTQGENIQLQSVNNHHTMIIKSLEFPLFNNIISASIVFNEGVGDLTTTLTNGMYDETTIQSYIASGMTATSLASGSAYTYTCSLNPITQILTISSTGAFALKFLSHPIIAMQIGFLPDNTTYTSATSHAGTYPIFLKRYSTIILSIGGIRNANYGISNVKINGDITLAFGLNNYISGNMVEYNPNVFEHKINIQGSNLQNTKTYLWGICIDKTTELINLQGQSFDFIIGFDE